MVNDPRRRARLGRLFSVKEKLVIAAILDHSHLGPFIGSASRACILAQFDLIGLEAAIKSIRAQADKIVFVNIDSITGLAQDRGGVDFLAKLGSDGIVTTRGSLIPRAQQAGLLTVQKLFITDRSNMQRGVAAVQSAKPDLLQLMPAPVLPFVADHEIMRLRPVIAGGFVADATSIHQALSHGAVGVSVSTPEMWNYTDR